MKKLITLACLGLAFAASAPAFAGAQQEKMKGCNKEAKGMKGDERKAFMKKCLSKEYVLKATAPAAPVAAKAPAAKATTTTASSGVAAADKAVASSKQQNKMKTCNEQVKTKALKGEERRTFMATCLKG